MLRRLLIPLLGLAFAVGSASAQDLEKRVEQLHPKKVVTNNVGPITITTETEFSDTGFPLKKEEKHSDHDGIYKRTTFSKYILRKDGDFQRTAAIDVLANGNQVTKRIELVRRHPAWGFSDPLEATTEEGKVTFRLFPWDLNQDGKPETYKGWATFKGGSTLGFRSRKAYFPESQTVKSELRTFTNLSTGRDVQVEEIHHWENGNRRSLARKYASPQGLASTELYFDPAGRKAFEIVDQTTDFIPEIASAWTYGKGTNTMYRVSRAVKPVDLEKTLSPRKLTEEVDYKAHMLEKLPNVYGSAKGVEMYLEKAKGITIKQETATKDTKYTEYRTYWQGTLVQWGYERHEGKRIVEEYVDRIDREAPEKWTFVYETTEGDILRRTRNYHPKGDETIDTSQKYVEYYTQDGKPIRAESIDPSTVNLELGPSEIKLEIDFDNTRPPVPPNKDFKFAPSLLLPTP